MEEDVWWRLVSARKQRQGAQWPILASPSRAATVCSMPQKHLQRAQRALQSEHPLPALNELRRAWIVAPSRELATLVELLASHFDRALPEIPGKGRAMRDAWLDTAMHRRSHDLGLLLDALSRSTIPLLRKQFVELAAFAPDPRIAKPVLRVAMSYNSSEARAMQTAAYRLVAKSGDGRVLDAPITDESEEQDRFQKYCKKLEHPPALETKLTSIVGLLKQEIETLLAGPPSSAETLVHSDGDSERDAFLTDITRAPEDDGARQVYADWLQEQGDPQGLFIAMQYKALRSGKQSGKERKAERDAIREHGDSWVRPLDSVVDKPQFERGLFAGGRIHFSTEAQRASLLDHPLWNLVTTIDGCNESKLLLHCAQHSLRNLHSPDAQTIAAISKLPAPLPLAQLKSHLFDREKAEATFARTRRRYQDDHDKQMQEHAVSDIEHWRSIAKVGSLQALRVLDIETVYFRDDMDAADFDWLFESKLMRQLEALTIRNRANLLDLASFSAVLERTSLRRLTLAGYPKDFYNSPNYMNHANTACHVRWELDSMGTTLHMDWPFYRGELRRSWNGGRDMRDLLRGYLAGFARLRKGQVRPLKIVYTKNKSKVDLKRFAEVGAMIKGYFSPIELP